MSTWESSKFRMAIRIKKNVGTIIFVYCLDFFYQISNKLNILDTLKFLQRTKDGLEVWKEGQERVFDSNTRCFRLLSRRLRLIRFSLSFVKCTISIVSAWLSIGTPTRLSISLGHSVRRGERDFFILQKWVHHFYEAGPFSLACTDLCIYKLKKRPVQSYIWRTSSKTVKEFIFRYFKIDSIVPIIL